MVTIAEQVQEFKDTTASQAPPQIAGVFTAEQQRLASDTDTGRLVKAGDMLAPFTLGDATGRQVSLASLLTDGPAVLVFYRGAWCPYCNIMLTAYAAELAPALRERGVALAAISPQTPDGSLTVAQRHELEFPVLSDPGLAVARPLGIVFNTTEDVRATQQSIGLDVAAVNGSDSAELPMPTVLVVSPDGTIAFADVRPDYTSRAEVPDILAAVDAALTASATHAQ